jgi:DHA1 family bicyclomycin/chloramphenicol resistance-like MFS transporter
MKQAKAKGMVLLTIILMDLLAGMEFDLFVPSFPELQDQFNLTPFGVEASLSVNFVGYCVSLFFVGGLGDSYGRKPVILVGLMTFVIGSLLCLYMPLYSWFLVGRFLQGVGVAAPALLSFLIIADAYSLKEQQFLLAMLNAVMNTSVAAAPVIGSYVTLYFHWQGNFMVLLLLGLIVLTMTMVFIPSQKLPEHKESLSLSGYSPIFQSKTLMLLMVSFIFSFVPYWIFVGMSPILFMEDLGVSLTHFGYYQGGLALAFALGSVLYGFFMDKFDQKKMLRFSILILVFSIVTVALVSFIDSPNPLLITLAFLPFCIAGIIPTTIIYPFCINFMPKAKGRVSAIIQGSRLILSALGLQIAGYYYQGSFQTIGIIITFFIILATYSMYLVSINRDVRVSLESR